MTRYIDANALKRKAQKVATEAWKMRIKSSVETILNQFIDWIEDMPTIDAVEVVRCKNCKYGSEDYPKNIFPDATEETYSCEHSTYSHDKDFYCKYGEKEQ